MSTPQLTAEQRKRIHGYVSSFREYSNSPEGRRDTQAVSYTHLTLPTTPYV